jgi:hypothetical protein
MGMTKIVGRARAIPSADVAREVPPGNLHRALRPRGRTRTCSRSAAPTRYAFCTLAVIAGDIATTPSPNGSLTPNQKAVAEAVASVWENDTPILDYAYSENTHDGRGYTSGRAGFCTGTGDAIQVIDCYDQRRTAANGNAMAKYMPALKAINDKLNQTGLDQGHTTLLDAVGSWVNDWGASYPTAATR